MAKPNISLLGATYSGVAGVTLPKSGGGTATFPWVEGSETKTENGTYDVTNLAELIVNVSGGGSVTQDQDGYIVLPSTGGGGGGSTLITKSITLNGTYDATDDNADGYSSVTVNVSGAQTTTGTFTGGGGITQSISCSFAPDLIYVHGDLSSDPSLRGVDSVIIIKNTALYVISDGSSSAYQRSLWQVATNIIDYNETNQLNEPYATYSNGTLSFNMVENTSSARFNASITYSYMLIKWS